MCQRRRDGADRINQSIQATGGGCGIFEKKRSPFSLGKRTEKVLAGEREILSDPGSPVVRGHVSVGVAEGLQLLPP